MGVVYPFPETDEVIYMKRAAEKLKSSRGASLMMALLLFLVCAVLGSVVLVAGTASAGRFANLSKMEQRYFAVNSAAELLRTELSGDQPFTVTRTKEVTNTTKIVIGEGGAVSYGSVEPGTPSYSYAVSPAVNAGNNAELLRYRLACWLVFGTDAPTGTLTQAQYDHDSRSAVSAVPGTMTITVDGKAELAVDVTVKLKENGQLELELSNHEGSEKYRLRMTFAANAEAETSKGEITKIVTTGSGMEEQTVVTETKTNKVSWNLGSIAIPEESEAGGGDGT